MAVAPRKWRDRETSPERTKVWVEPKPRSTHRRVPVVYYLSRNGQLEHPHFMEVPLSSSDGLYLKDVVDRLNVLRGKGMATMYAWSSKRSYKNGYVWHDLTEDDLILPAHGNEYVLKGSEVLFPEISPIVHEPPPSASSSFEKPPVVPSREQRRTSWGGSLDLAEYKVYKSDTTTATLSKAADAATQTDDRRLPRRRSPDFAPPQPEAELGSEDISPPPSSSSPETLETLIKSEVKITGPRSSHVAPSDQLDESDPDQMVGIASGRMRASAVLMQFISCGSLQVKDSSAVQYSEKMRRRRSDLSGAKDLSLTRNEMDGMSGPGQVGFDPMDREYFSGSLVETKKKEVEDSGTDGFGGLKRSNSYNADRSSKFDTGDNNEIVDTFRAKCIPRKPRGVTTRKEESASNSSQISRSNLGSKRISDGA